MFKYLILVLLPTAILAKTLKPEKETYASYAARNGIPLAKSEASYQYADCYDYFGQQGYSRHITDYVPNLGQDSNRFSSCCYYGIWILYADVNYNQNNQNGAAQSAWGENYCEDLTAFDNQASSIRFTGAPDGYKYDTINFFQYQFYMGAEHYYYGDSTQVNYDNFGRSAVITGYNAWTVYEYNNYQGRCACLYPSDMNNGYPGFYKDLGQLSDTISSVRKGCQAGCNNKMVPSNSNIVRGVNGKIVHSETYQGTQ